MYEMYIMYICYSTKSQSNTTKICTIYCSVRQKMVKDLRDMQRLTEHALKIEEADEEDSIKSNTTESN